LFPQSHTILTGSSVGALSIKGLGTQAITFAFVVVASMFRLTVPMDLFKIPSIWAFREWYGLVGWAIVDNVIFAIVQMILFFLAWRRMAPQDAAQETRPLLE
jgi:hypothetical protein